MPLDLPPQAHIFADAGYLDQHEEALLADTGLHLVAQRRKNSKEPFLPWVSYIAKRKRIKTVFSRIAAAFGRTIYAVTPRGFELKGFLTVLAYSMLAMTQKRNLGYLTLAPPLLGAGESFSYGTSPPPSRLNRITCG